MKKSLLLVTLVLVMMLSGCKSDMQKALGSMDDLESYTMLLTNYDVPIVGDVEMTIEIDGNLTAMNLIGLPFYTKTIDDEVFIYELQLDGSYDWSEEPQEGAEAFFYHQFLNANDFEEVDGEWHQTVDIIYVDDEQENYMQDAVVVVNDEGYIELLTFDLVANDVVSAVEVEYSLFNETDIQLPE